MNKCPLCPNTLDNGYCCLCEYKKGQGNVLFKALTSDEKADCTFHMVHIVSMILGVLVNVSVNYDRNFHSENRTSDTTKKYLSGLQVNLLLHIDFKKRHFTVEVDGKVYDFGQYTANPILNKDNEDIRTMWKNFLRINGWSKNCANSCLPMCLIIGTFLYLKKNNPKTFFSLKEKYEEKLTLKFLKEEDDLARKLRQEQAKDDEQVARKLQEEEDDLARKLRQEQVKEDEQLARSFYQGCNL